MSFLHFSSNQQGKSSILRAHSIPFFGNIERYHEISPEFSDHISAINQTLQCLMIEQCLVPEESLRFPLPIPGLISSFQHEEDN